MSASSTPYIGQPVERYSYHTVPESHDVMPAKGVDSSSSTPVSGSPSSYKSLHVNKLLWLRASCWEVAESISDLDIVKTVKFIETHREIIGYIQGKGGGFLDRNVYILPRSLYITDDGEIIINLKVHTEDAKLVGKGTYKTVTLALSYDWHQIYAFAVSHFKNEKQVIVAANDLDLSMKFSGCEHIVQCLRAVSYCHGNKIIPTIPFKQGVYMPYYAGGNLFYLFKKAIQLDSEQASFMFDCAIRGLETIHDKGIIHRDLKPENILLEEEEHKGKDFYHLFIADLGFGIKASEAENERDFPGNALFVAPEYLYHQQCLKFGTKPEKPMWTSKVDIYALGLIFGYIYFGVFPNATLPYGLYNVWWEDLDNEPKDRTLIHKIIWKMTRTDPDERPTCTEIRKMLYDPKQ